MKLLKAPASIKGSVPCIATFFNQAIYGYDHASRLAVVSDGTNEAAYSYLANSSLAGQIVFASNSFTSMTTTKQYDFLNRLSSISSSPSNAFNYEYNAANQRTMDRLSDGSYWSYGYDALGQVISGSKYWADETPVAGQQFDYAFDTIGNRTQTEAGGDQNGANLRVAYYTNNNLNQIASRTVPGYVDIMGDGIATNAVGVNGLTAYRKNEFFRQQVAVSNGAAAVWTNITVTNNGSSVSGHAFVAQTPEIYSYDVDGNLLIDGRWNYSWDAENRLTNMTSLSSAPGGSQLQLAFKYDYMGRRIQKLVSTNNGSAYVGEYTNTFAYDGWNCLVVLNSSLGLLNSFLWGSDLSGSLQGSGGVGGLVKVTYYGTTTTNCFVAYDGNSNVSALVNAADGTTVANYEYGPFGELIRETGPMAKVNPFRFSTKYCDDETDLLYYGYRYYNPSTGRWISRDPIQEASGINLYQFVRNDALDKYDLIGLCSELIGKNGLPRMVFTDPHGGWSGGTLTFGGKTGGGSVQEYTTATVDYTADVTVLCTCPCGQRTGVRVFEQQADGSWRFYNPGTVGIGIDIPTVTGVLQGLGKLGAKWINTVIGAGVMVQSEIDDAAKAVSALPHPTLPTDGTWKGGKSPCSK